MYCLRAYTRIRISITVVARPIHSSYTRPIACLSVLCYDFLYNYNVIIIFSRDSD